MTFKEKWSKTMSNVVKGLKTAEESNLRFIKTLIMEQKYKEQF